MIRAVILSLLMASAAAAAERVFVAGGSGRSGIEMVKAFRAAGYDVTASTRDAAQAADRHGSDITWVRLDMFALPDVIAAVAGHDIVISALGHGDFIGPEAPQFVQYLAVRNLIDAAKAAKAKHMLLMSSSTAGHRFDHRLEARFGMVLYWMTKAEDYLAASGLGWTVLGPGGLYDAEILALRGLPPPPAEDWGARIMPRPDYKFDFVSRAGVAQVALAAVRDPAARGKAVAIVWDREGRGAKVAGGFGAVAVEPATETYPNSIVPKPRRPGPVQMQR